MASPNIGSINITQSCEPSNFLVSKSDKPQFNNFAMSESVNEFETVRSLCGVVSCTPEAEASVQASSPSAGSSRSSRPSRYYTWSELMRRVFEIDVLHCPRCRASPTRILAGGYLEITWVADPRTTDHACPTDLRGLVAGRTLGRALSRQLHGSPGRLTARAGAIGEGCARAPRRR